MVNFPKDKVPPNYDQHILTQQMEDIYSNLSKIDPVIEDIDMLRDDIAALEDGLGQVNSAMALNKIQEQTVMPPPTDLEIRKIARIPVVFVKCKHLEIIKYPYVRGFQFFISQQHDFTPTSESGEVTLTGTHSGVAGMTLSHTADLTLSTVPGFLTKYTNIPFWAEMHATGTPLIPLVGCKVINATDNSTGAVTVWSNLLPWQMTTTLVGGATNQWNNGDSYALKVYKRDNLIHQGPLPIAVYLLRPNQTGIANLM